RPSRGPARVGRGGDGDRWHPFRQGASTDERAAGPRHGPSARPLLHPDRLAGAGGLETGRSAGPGHVAETSAGAHETPPRRVGASRSGLALHDGHSAPGSAPPAGLRLADPVRRENPPARERLAVVARSGGDAQDDERGGLSDHGADNGHARLRTAPHRLLRPPEKGRGVLTGYSFLAT